MGIGVSQGPWTLVCFFTDNVLGEDFDLDRFLSKSGIMIHMVPHIVEHKHSGSYELVVATPYLDLLLERVQGHGFKLVVNHDPFKPAEEDVRIHGMWEAKRRARVNTLSNAADAIRNGWGYGPAECYRSVIAKAGLGTELERTILNWDIQVSYSHILLPLYLLMNPSIPILGSFNISHKTSYSSVSIVVTVMTPLRPSMSLGGTRPNGFNLSRWVTQPYSKY